MQIRVTWREIHLRPEENSLDVLRGLISDVTNAAKTSKPVTRDAQIVQIIRKRVKSSEAAVKEFERAKRDDLKDREVAQIAVLETYIGDSGSLEADDIAKAIQDVIGRMRSEGKSVNQGSVMKCIVGPGGKLDDQPVDKQLVANMVKGELLPLSCFFERFSFLSWKPCHGSERLPGAISRPRFDPNRYPDSEVI